MIGKQVLKICTNSKLFYFCVSKNKFSLALLRVLQCVEFSHVRDATRNQFAIQYLCKLCSFYLQKTLQIMGPKAGMIFIYIPSRFDRFPRVIMSQIYPTNHERERG